MGANSTDTWTAQPSAPLAPSHQNIQGLFMEQFQANTSLVHPQPASPQDTLTMPAVLAPKAHGALAGEGSPAH